MYSDNAKAGAATYRRRALAIIEAATSGAAIAEQAGHKKLAREFRNAVLWGESIKRLSSSSKR